jgi:N-acetylneuraminic acid mutarotase
MKRNLDILVCLALWLGPFACASSATPPPAKPSGQPSAPASAPQALPASEILESSVLELPRPVTSFGAAAHDGALFTYGGYFGKPHAYSREGQVGELLRIDIAARSVQNLADGEGVQGAQLASSGPDLVRIGGMRAENAAGEPEQLVSLTDAARFDAAAQRWQPLTPMPEGRSSHAVAVIGRRLYVLGGWTLGGQRDAGRFANQAFVLDLEANKWTPIAQPFQTRAAGAGVVSGKIALVGGIDASGKTQRTVHLLDPQTGSWSTGPDFPVDAFGAAVTSNGKSLFASARSGLIYELSDLAAGWHPVAALAFPRFFHQLVMLDDHQLAVLGGISGMHEGPRISHLEVIDVQSRAPRVMSWTLRAPGTAKNRQGAAVLNDSLVVFGGNNSLNQHDFEPKDFSADAFELELADMAFTRLPSFPAARQTVQTVALDDALLALGGFGHDGEKARAHSEAFVFDLAKGAWLPYGSNLPSPRTQFGLVAHGDDLWVFGGLDYDPSREGEAQFAHPTVVLRAKQGKPFAPTSIELPHPRRAFGGAMLGDRYYMVGGMAGGFQPIEACDAFDFASSKWSTFTCPELRISPQLVALDDKLYLAGGSSPGKDSDLAANPRLEVFDPKTGSWSTVLETIPIEPRHLTMLAYRHALLLYSAHRTDQTVQVVLIVPPVSG